MSCTCTVGPGKFERQPAFVFMAYAQAMLGNADVTVGDQDFLRAPWGFDADQSVVNDALAYGYCPACVESYADRYEDVRGVVVWTDDVGFVHCGTYATADLFDAAIATAEAADDDETA